MDPAASAESTDQTASALDRIKNATWTEADLDYLRQEEPEIAAQVTDPSAPVESGAVEEEENQVSAQLATNCKAVRVWFRRRNLLGSTAFVWHHRASWCYTGSRVTRWNGRYDYVTEMDGVHRFERLIVNRRGSLGGCNTFSHLQREITNCVARYGCWATNHPWSKFRMNARGQWI